ncbi:MAG: YfdX family protein [Deltaproteobacteria bacterium]|nr:YfdX family protein [Deltaproteobacteria bacterium]
MTKTENRHSTLQLNENEDAHASTRANTHANMRTSAHTHANKAQRQATTPIVVGLLAALFTGGAAVAAAKSKVDDMAALDAVSQESAAAMGNIRIARRAIFDGHPVEAKRFLATARSELDKAEKQRPQTKVTVRTEKKIGNKVISSDETSETVDLVPIDRWIGVSEDFVPSATNNNAVKRANEKLKSGNTKDAIEQLKAADVGVSVTRVLIPLDTTSKHLNQAIKLVNEDKYYEANLELMAAEQGAITDSVVLREPTAANTVKPNSK